MSEKSNNDSLKELAQLRAQIDTLDHAMHQSLIERGEIVAQLQKAKQTAVSGSAFRPLREMQMMHAFAAAHKGELPLSLILQLWRVIISTFTYQQAPYHVHVLAQEREAARAHFGFNVPFIESASVEEIIAKVKQAKGDLGFIGLKNNASAWWRGLGEENPLIMATYPVLSPPEAVIIAPAQTDTQGLMHKFVATKKDLPALCQAQDEKLVLIPRDMVCEGSIVGYA